MDRASDYDGPDSRDLKLFIFVGWNRSSFLMMLGRPWINDLYCFTFPVVLFGSPGISNCHTTRCICRVLVCFIVVLQAEVFVYHGDSLTT